MFYKLQPFNKELTAASLVILIISVLSLVFNNHTRRKYYFANYLTVAVSSVANVFVGVWSLINVLEYKRLFLNIEFEAISAIKDSVPPSVLLNKGVDPENLAGPYSTFWFDAVWFVSAVLLIATLLNIANAVFKTVLMSKEKQLLMEGEN
jgi:hypothetical protein